MDKALNIIDSDPTGGCIITPRGTGRIFGLVLGVRGVCRSHSKSLRYNREASVSLVIATGNTVKGNGIAVVGIIYSRINFYSAAVIPLIFITDTPISSNVDAK